MHEVVVVESYKIGVVTSINHAPASNNGQHPRGSAYPLHIIRWDKKECIIFSRTEEVF